MVQARLLARAALARAPKPRGPVQALAALGLALSLIRFSVLFVESYSIVSSERAADYDLLRLCSAGAAADSSKFRSLCLSARADSAAPLLFKAILKSLKTAVHDFFEAFNSPTKIALLLLFCISGLALPVVKAVTTLATQHLGKDPLARLHGLHLSDDEDEPTRDQCRVVVLNGATNGSTWSRLNRRLRRLPKRRDDLLTIKDEDEHALFGDTAPFAEIGF